MEGRAATVDELRGVPAWLLGLVPLVLIMVAIGAFAVLDGPGLASGAGRRPRSWRSSARS